MTPPWAGPPPRAWPGSAAVGRSCWPGAASSPAKHESDQEIRRSVGQEVRRSGQVNFSRKT